MPERVQWKGNVHARTTPEELFLAGVRRPGSRTG